MAMAGIAIGGGDIGGGGIPGAGGVGSGGGDVSAELGAMFAGMDGSDAGADATPGGEGGAGDSQPVESPIESPGGETPTPAQADQAEALGTNEQTPAQTAQPNAEPIPGWKLNEDGTYTVAATELPRVQSALQYADSVGQYFQSAQEAQGAYAGASQMRQMQNDWAYGTDDAIKSVLQFLAGSSHPDPAGRMAFQRSFTKMMSVAPNILKTSNPQAYASVVQSMNTHVIDVAYEKAAQISAQFGAGSEVAKQALVDAQSVEWGMTGKYRNEVPQLDPQAQARSTFEQQQRDFNARQEAAERRDVGAFNNQFVEGAKLAKLDAMIAEKLAPIKDRYTDIAFKDLVVGIHREVMDTVAKQSDWYTEHRQAFDQLIGDYQTTWRNGSPGQGLQPRINAYIQDFINRAGRILPAIAQTRINAATKTAVNLARGKTGANGRTGNAPTPRPTPSPSSNAPANGQVQNGESRSARFDREFNAMFKSV